MPFHAKHPSKRSMWRGRWAFTSFAAGHHATTGNARIRALGDWLVTTQGLDVTFVDIDNPV